MVRVRYVSATHNVPRTFTAQHPLRVNAVVSKTRRFFYSCPMIGEGGGGGVRINTNVFDKGALRILPFSGPDFTYPLLERLPTKCSHTLRRCHLTPAGERFEAAPLQTWGSSYNNIPPPPLRTML